MEMSRGALHLTKEILDTSALVSAGEYLWQEESPR